MSKEIPCQSSTPEKGLIRHYAFLERKQEVHGNAGGRGRGKLGETGCGSGRVSELLGRFSRRVSTAVIACATLIAETQNNQL